MKEVNFYQEQKKSKQIVVIVVVVFSRKNKLSFFPEFFNAFECNLQQFIFDHPKPHIYEGFFLMNAKILNFEQQKIKILF